MSLVQVHALLQLVEHSSAASMDAKVLKGQLEVRLILLHVEAQQFARNERTCKDQLLRERGSTVGPNTVRLSFRQLLATFMRSFDSETPVYPTSSSS